MAGTSRSKVMPDDSIQFEDFSDSDEDETNFFEDLSMFLEDQTLSEESLPNWREIDAPYEIHKLLYNPESEGIRIPMAQRPTSVLGFFQLFFTDELIMNIVNETNRYALEKINSKMPLGQKSGWNNWRELTVPEFKTVLAMILNMAMHVKKNRTRFFLTRVG